MIGPETLISVEGKSVPAGKVKGIVFGQQQNPAGQSPAPAPADSSTMTIVRNGIKQTVTKQQLYKLAAQGMIGPETPVTVNGKTIPAGKAKGIVFKKSNETEFPLKDEFDEFGLPLQQETIDPYLLQPQEERPRIQSIQQHERSQGPQCPVCGGPGPIGTYQSYRVISVIVLTSWATIPRTSCRRCVKRAIMTNGMITMFFGWWGVPFGFILTPFYLLKNFLEYRNL